MATDHNPGQLLCILLNLVFVVGTSLVIVCSLANQYGFSEPIPQLLRQDLQDTANNKPSPISPASWIHCAWAIVFLWQLIFVFHALNSVCRKWTGVPVYTYPVLISSSLLSCFNLACAFNVAWFVFYDRGYSSTACLFIVLSVILGWAAYGLSLYSLEINLFRLRKAERYKDICMQRFIVHWWCGWWCVIVARVGGHRQFPDDGHGRGQDQSLHRSRTRCSIKSMKSIGEVIIKWLSWLALGSR
ncbi:hypothetical protein PoB_007457400 [Plakobranchus ocellatus]|uniref:Uncharacterized protein n=1 Tax=Plakobranchus ocellatus TaxID=259542 RepID=A0AAV4DUZ9_9GAST|nr:hypothetical protein PoB_007457400 [Plakobranchus ocellatus]